MSTVKKTLERYWRLFFGSSRRKGYLYTLQKNRRVTKPRRKARTQIGALIQKYFRNISKPRKGRSYLSRSEKRTRYGKIIGKTAAVVFGVILTLGIVQKPVLHYVETLDFFWLKNISIQGCKVTNQSEIKEIAGLDYTTSLFTVDQDMLRNKLIARDWIKDVWIKKVWPNSIRIEIREHKAEALLVIKEKGRLVYLNSHGETIAPVHPGDDLDYPVITTEVEATESGADELLQDAVYFLRLAARNDPNLPAQSVSEIHLNSKEGMVVRLVDFPFPIYFGHGDVYKKYKQLREVLAVLYKKRRNTTDISQVDYIRMEYYDNKVLVAQSNSG